MKNELKKISDSLILYTSSGSYRHIHEIETCLKEYFLADGIIFWRYQSAQNTIDMFSKTEHKALALSSSLIKKTIDTKSSMVLDHVSSNKFYTADIDNPLKLKIKSMMIFPIVKKNKVVGVISLYKDIKRRKKFVEHDSIVFQKFALYLLPLYDEKTVQKSNLNAKNHLLETLPKKEKELKDTKIHKKKENTTELELEIKALKNVFSGLEKENKVFKDELDLLKNKEKESITKLNEQNNKYETLETNYTNSTKAYESEIVALKEQIKEQKTLLDTYEKNDIKQKKSIDNYKQEIEELKEIEKEFQKVHKNIVIKYEKNELKQLNTIEKYKNIIENLKNKLSQKSKDNKNKNSSEELTSMKEELAYLNKEIEYFDSEVKKLEEENEALNKVIQEHKENAQQKSKKEHKEMWLQKKDAKENYNMEYILQEVDTIFGAHEQTYMLFELMVFSLSSADNMQMIENKLQNSKIVPHIVEEFKFGNTLKIHKEKYLVSDFIEHIRSYEHTIFPSKIKFNITEDRFMPTFFIFDAPKVQSMVLHLLMDLQEFIDTKKNIDMHFTHNTKLLHIEIGGKLPQETGGLLSALTKKNIVKDISKRPALQISRGLLNSFDYDIEPIYKEKYYRFILDVPIEIP